MSIYGCRSCPWVHQRRPQGRVSGVSDADAGETLGCQIEPGDEAHVVAGEDDLERAVTGRDVAGADALPAGHVRQVVDVHAGEHPVATRGVHPERPQLPRVVVVDDVDRVLADADAAQLRDVVPAATCKAAQDGGHVEAFHEHALAVTVALHLDLDDVDLGGQACQDEARVVGAGAVAADRGGAEGEALGLEALEALDVVELQELVHLGRVEVDGVQAAARELSVLVGHEDAARI
mmetsp:Transcript_40704/g.88778  ORF Transcript_40704/g.88778 Transcript_40704/m.88778 type:complete len:235 (+) Transcript_40704:18-722(+)